MTANQAAVSAVITTLDYGGAERQLVDVAKKLRTRGWQFSVISLVRPVAFVEELDRAGISVASLQMRSGVPDPRAILRLRRLLGLLRPDVVHSHMFHANFLTRLARPWLPDAVFISTSHNIWEGGRVREALYRLTDRRADLTTSVSEAAARRYVEVGAVSRERVRVVPNGVDAKQFHPPTDEDADLRGALHLDGRFVWLSVGRFTDSKDHPTLMRAFAQVAHERPHALLLLVGAGAGREAAEAQARQLGIDGSVRFLGIRDDVPDLMRASDAYVMSSAWEGLPIVLLEASASALPIVTTDAGGTPEVVSDGETGRVVPPGRPDLLAAAMCDLMNLPEEERSRMGHRGRHLVEDRYSLDVVTDTWEEIYRDLMARHG